jgi:hypothetical protein
LRRREEGEESAERREEEGRSIFIISFVNSRHVLQNEDFSQLISKAI